MSSQWGVVEPFIIYLVKGRYFLYDANGKYNFLAETSCQRNRGEKLDKLTRAHSGLPRPRNIPHVWLSHRHTPTDTAAERVSGPSTGIDDRGSCLADGERFVLSRIMEM